MTIAVDRLPPEVRESVRCVVWKYERRDGAATKVPYRPTAPDRRAAVDDSRSWGSFAAALAAVNAGQADGVGIVLGDGLVGVDLDHCREVTTGAITAEAMSIIQALNSYAEVSPSAMGLHILAHGVLPPGGRRKGAVEMYSTARYFTVTGQHVAGTPTTIEERTLALAALHARLFATNRHDARPTRRPALPLDRDDATLLGRAHGARNGAKFAALWRGDVSAYPSQSEADQALCNLLAFWTAGDGARVDRLFRQSALMRKKWDAQRGDRTYGERTIARAIA